MDVLRVPGRRRRSQVAWDRSTEGPQVIAHRGASLTAAEHTLAAYMQALKDGADGLECDVRLTADGHLVCVHDRRVDRTSNGRGPVSRQAARAARGARLGVVEAAVEGARRRVRRGCDLASKTSILTLERLLDTVHDWGQPVDLAIETKHPTRYAGLVEQRLVELLDRYGWARPKRGQVSPGAGDELLVDEPAALPGACPGAGDGLPDGPHAAAVPRRYAPARLARGGAVDEHHHVASRVRRQGTLCRQRRPRVDGERAGRGGALRGPRRRRRSSPTTPPPSVDSSPPAPADEPRRNPQPRNSA